MQKAVITLVGVSGLTVASIWYSHKIKIDQKERMHAGVVRDIALEAQQLQMKQLESAAAQEAASSSADPDCENGVCDLKATRFRDPSTGHVYRYGEPQLR